MSSHSAAQLQRKVKKPLIEKKRRERINKCLRELKKLVLHATDPDSSRLTAKMEKAEILEMTVAYVSQLHGARCRTSGAPVGAAPARMTSSHPHDEAAVDSTPSSEEYEVGYSECLFHVQRFLADRASMLTDAALPQMLLNHLSQFAANSRCLERSSPPSPDTTLAALSPCSQAPPLPPSPSSPTGRPVFLQHSEFQVEQSSHVTVLSSLNDVLRRYQRPDEPGLAIDPSALHLRRQPCVPKTVFVMPTAISRPLYSTAFLLPSPSKSLSMSSSPGCVSDDVCSTYIQPSSPANDDAAVWRPWKPEADACCDVSEASL